MAIEATDSNSVPTTGESLLVRNADAYSHLISIHFFAKSYFAQDIDSFIDWYSKTVFTDINIRIILAIKHIYSSMPKFSYANYYTFVLFL